ncbi:MAG: hypothetical protein EON59_15190 [Alphaproteobacteria bacterium]|nr:MAG: hypothetical protein EON59_15190 [Alphaproteobacteria bacterium]
MFKQMTDAKSNSTRTQLWRGLSTMPGTSLVNVCAVCDAPTVDEQGIFFGNQPDTVMAIFNSPFGPDVLVTTDRLSEGVDLHRFCRHLIHHELDPSPVRTVQRNGRLRRVGSLASRTGRPIEVSYPALLGTRDERVVEIMQLRLKQFDLLLGGVGHDVNADQTSMEKDQITRILAQAQVKMGKFDLTSPRRQSGEKG